MSASRLPFQPRNWLSSMQLDQRQAQALFDAGGFFILPLERQGQEFGIDGSIWAVKSFAVCFRILCHANFTFWPACLDAVIIWNRASNSSRLVYISFYIPHRPRPTRQRSVVVLLSVKASSASRCHKRSSFASMTMQLRKYEKLYKAPRWTQIDYQMTK